MAIYRVVIGTAGHIDHGKSSLVRCLTGIDPDRLREEKERGLTIDLGFAPWRLSDGSIVGMIDVPGHEKFIKNMVAGVSGVDFLLLVVAADDGVMPQTKEHLQIAHLLGVRRGMVAITKIDTVDEEILELVAEEVRELTQGTFLEGAPLCFVSSTTGEGIEELAKVLEREIKKVPPRFSLGPFRMPIQRVFAAPGYGSVVTGVPVAGIVSVGDRVEVLPKGWVCRVRKIQAYKQDIASASTGHSTALNLTDVDYRKIRRGDVVALPGYFSPHALWEADFFYLPHHSRELKSHTQIKLHIGTKEVMGKVICLGKPKLSPGEVGWIQLVLTEPVVAGYGDPFILRLPSPPALLGGGRILGRSKKKYHAGRKEMLPLLKQKKENWNTPEGRIRMAFLEEEAPLSKEEALKKAELLPSEWEEGEKKLKEKGELLFLSKSKQLFWKPMLENIKEDLKKKLHQYHKSHPLSLGMSQQSLLSSNPKRRELELLALQELLEKGEVKKEKELYSLASFTLELTPSQKEKLEQLENEFFASLFSPPRPEEVLPKLFSKEKEGLAYLEFLKEKGILLTLGDIVFHRQAVEEAKKRLKEELAKKPLTMSEIRQILGTSRKFAVPLLEYLDEQGFTKREGNVRRLC